MGMIPERLQSPTVGLTPTMPLIDEGHMIDPPVSVPIVKAARLAEAEPVNDNGTLYGIN